MEGIREVDILEDTLEVGILEDILVLAMLDMLDILVVGIVVDILVGIAVDIPAEEEMEVVAVVVEAVDVIETDARLWRVSVRKLG